jgi:hypothetical protein
LCVKFGGVCESVHHGIFPFSLLKLGRPQLSGSLSPVLLFHYTVFIGTVKPFLEIIFRFSLTFADYSLTATSEGQGWYAVLATRRGVTPLTDCTELEGLSCPAYPPIWLTASQGILGFVASSGQWLINRRKFTEPLYCAAFIPQWKTLGLRDSYHRCLSLSLSQRGAACVWFPLLY